LQQIYELWLNQICGTATSEKRYREDIGNFEKWAKSNHGLDVSEIPKRWREAKYSDKQADRERFLDELKDIVSDYFVYLKKYGYTSLSINRAMATVMSFHHYFDIPLKPIRIRHPFVLYHNRDITKDEIRTILKNSGVRNRAVYLVLYETGMRPKTALNLRWKHIKDDFLARKVPMKIKLTSDILKCGVSERFVFIGQDGYDALSLYIRRRGLPLDDEEFVFVTEKPFGKPIGDNSISQAFNVIVQRLKLSEPRGQLTKDGRKNKPKDLRLYTLRKAFSKFMAVNIDRTLVEYWLGHTSTATHYVSEDIEFHRAQYAKGYPSIQLELSQVPANITEELKKKDQEISKLKEDMEKLKPLMNFINAFDEPEELEHFLNLWKSADAIRFPPDKGEFSIVDLPEEIQETVDRVAKETGRKKNDIINELINLGSKASRQPDENPNKK
jgi:integrase